MAQARLEHVNIAVSDTKRTAALLAAIFGWKTRWEGPSQLGGWTVHIGNTHDYLAIWSPDKNGGAVQDFQKGAPLNHVGIVVDDLEAVEAKVAAQGLIPFNHMDYDPGRRFYFFDRDHIEWEVVSYASPAV